MNLHLLTSSHVNVMLLYQIWHMILTECNYLVTEYLYRQYLIQQTIMSHSVISAVQYITTVTNGMEQCH